jgi:hypothetical protein
MVLPQISGTLDTRKGGEGDEEGAEESYWEEWRLRGRPASTGAGKAVSVVNLERKPHGAQRWDVLDTRKPQRFEDWELWSFQAFKDGVLAVMVLGA